MSECEQVSEAIAWVANGTASPQEQRGVHRHVAACGACRHDLAQALALRQRVNDAADALPGLSGGVWPELVRDPAVSNRLGALRRLVPVMERSGLPALVAGLLTRTLGLAEGRLRLRLAVPLMAPVEVRF